MSLNYCSQPAEKNIAANILMLAPPVRLGLGGGLSLRSAVLPNIVGH